MAEMEATHGPNNMNFHLPKPVSSDSSECRTCQQQKPVLNPWYGTVSQRPTGHLLESWWRWAPFIMERPAVSPHRDRALFQVWTRLSCPRASASTAIQELRSAWSMLMENYTTWHRVGNTLHNKGGHVIHRTYPILHHPEAADLTELGVGFLKVQLKHQLRVQNLQKWDAIFQNAE